MKSRAEVARNLSNFVSYIELQLEILVLRQNRYQRKFKLNLAQVYLVQLLQWNPIFQERKLAMHQSCSLKGLQTKLPIGEFPSEVLFCNLIYTSFKNAFILNYYFPVLSSKMGNFDLLETLNQKISVFFKNNKLLRKIGQTFG